MSIPRALQKLNLIRFAYTNIKKGTRGRFIIAVPMDTLVFQFINVRKDRAIFGTSSHDVTLLLGHQNVEYDPIGDSHPVTSQTFHIVNTSIGIGADNSGISRSPFSLHGHQRG